MGKKRRTVVPAAMPDLALCPKCGTRNHTTAVMELRVDMRPVLTEAVPFFPEALAQVFFLKCTGCGYRICLDYFVELDDCPELDLNEERVSEPA